MANPFEEKEALINGADKQFFDTVAKADQQLANEITKILASYSVGGVLAFDATQMAQLEKVIIEAIAKTDYARAVNAYLPNFDAIQALNVEIHELVNGINVGDIVKENDRIVNYISQVTSKIKATPSTSIQVTNIVNGKTVKTFETIRNTSLDQLINPIADIIRTDVITGISLEDATDAISDAITKNKLGLHQWSEQIALDALSQADGVTQDEIRLQFDMKFIRWVGGLKTTSRPCCYDFVKKGPVWEIDKLEKELALFIVDGVPLETTTTFTANGKQQKRGSGMIPGTSISNLLVYRGGYRCEHQAIPAKRAPLKE